MCKKIFLLCLVTISLIVSVSYAEEDILIVTEEWPPYNYLENEEITGFSAEIVQNLLAIMNKDYEIQLLPSMRTTKLLNTRPHTMMFSLFRTPERESQYKWIGPLGDASIFFYKRKDDDRTIESLEDMKNVKRIACRHAGLIPDLLIEHGFKNLDMTATGSLPIYQKLLGGRCDLAISDADLGVRYHLKSLNVKLDDVFEKIPIPIFEAELYLAASKDISDEEIQEWQSALEELKTNGLYEKIFQKYN
jgi:polar amino acid transport system substrate-binding protein